MNEWNTVTYRDSYINRYWLVIPTMRSECHYKDVTTSHTLCTVGLQTNGSALSHLCGTKCCHRAPISKCNTGGELQYMVHSVSGLGLLPITTAFTLLITGALQNTLLGTFQYIPIDAIKFILKHSTEH
jgi:hypothetical protein